MEIAANYTDEFLNAQRQAGDPLADAFTNKIFADLQQKTDLRVWMSLFDNNRQFYNLPVLYANEQLFLEANRLPGWAEPKLMEKGAAFFASHADAIMNLLGLLSLPYCYTAANGAMVLYLSDRLRVDARKRLIETAGFVWDVMAPAAFDENGKAFASILKVRLMHSAARYYTLKSDKWDMALGFPVNQEDMAGTNLSFSFIVVRGLRKLGFSIPHADQMAFIHLWNVIGFLMGLDKQLLAETGKDALELERAISSRQFRESVQGKALTSSLTSFFVTASTKAPYSASEVVGLMQYLLGDDVSAMLGINGQKLPANKLKLMKAINLFSELKLPDDTVTAYRKGYTKFKALSTS